MTVQWSPSTPQLASMGEKSFVIDTTPDAWRSSRRSSASNVPPTRRPILPARRSASADIATLCRSWSQNTHGTPSRRHHDAATDLATSGTLQARTTSGRNRAATRMNRRPYAASWLMRRIGE